MGDLSQPVNNLIDNIRTACANVFKYCPGGLQNMRSLSLQLVTGGPSLPLFMETGMFFSAVNKQYHQKLYLKCNVSL